MNPLTQSKNTTILPVIIALTLGCFGLLPHAPAACQKGCDRTNANTFLGDDALSSNTAGSDNTATGVFALKSNTDGYFNTATGSNALLSNTTGNTNTAIGALALQSNTIGSTNVATGVSALLNNTAGNNNTAIGYFALSRCVLGNNNIAIGSYAGAFLSGSNNICLSAFGATGENNTMRLGKYGVQKTTFIAGVSGGTVPAGVPVIVDTLGHMGTINSSVRYKENIQPMAKSSEAILALQPVTFHYKHELDPQGIPQFGLIAEQVEEVNPDLVARDDKGKPYTVRYEAVNAMLLNEFLKEHRKGEQQDRKIEDLEATVAKLQSALKAQAAQIQKVSDQLSKQAPAPRVVAND
jgi:hypothetical protein